MVLLMHSIEIKILTGNKIKGEKIFVPSLEQTQAGFSIGGPIIKNKLFFFANYEIEKRSDLGSNFVANDGRWCYRYQ